MAQEKATDQAGHSIVMPGTATDLAKAVRELIGAVRDVGSLVSDVVSGGAVLIDKRRAKKAAKNLSVLSFTPDGSRKYLEHIAAGRGTADDLKSIGAKMADTAGEVEKSIMSLERFREHVRSDYGMAAAHKLDELIHGTSGKKELRHTLRSMAAEKEVEHARSTARHALKIIERLNQQLDELHDMIAPPRKKT